MKPSKGSGHLVRNIILTALLAVICIGGVELAACRYFAPETYERIVAPVRYAANVVADTGKAALDAAGRFFRAAADKTVELANQAAQFTIRQASALAAHAAAVWEDLTCGPEILLEAPSQPPEDLPGIASDPPVTELIEVNGQQVLTGGITPIIYFCQADEEWAEQLYGTDPIGPYGCGPTAMAMVVASLTDTDTDPAQMSAWAVEHGHWARHSGSYHSIVQGIAQDFGLKAESITDRTVENLYDLLSSGHIVVALMGKGHFTNGGHFILLRGSTLAGGILVADPISRERSLEVWDPQLILDELSSARNSGAPLWAVSVPTT